jgi:hypothetical protein
MNQVSLKPQVRTAGPADESEVLRLLMLANAENAVMPSNSMRVYSVVQRFLNGHLIPPEDTGMRGQFGVIGKVGRLEGVVMVGIGQFWYSDQRHLEEFLVFVDPEYRQGQWRHGVALIDWLKDLVRKTGLPMISGILSNNRTEAKCRLYRRHMPKIGEYFFYDGTDKPNFESDKMTGPGSLVLVGSSSMAA